MIAGFAVITSLAGAILSQTFHDHRPSQAREMAENYAANLIARRETAMHSVPSTSGERSPASVNPVMLPDVGAIGQDPWGQAYRYRIGFDAAKNETHAFVWSVGPNGRSESDSAVEGAIGSTDINHFRFKGDDLGTVKTSGPGLKSAL
jgi:hypothetical protein